MSSMMRKLMRNVRRNTARKPSAGNGTSVGTVRAGMHQAAEYAYRRSRMAENTRAEDPEEKVPDNAPETEAVIPPEDGQGTAAEAVAEGAGTIGADEDILEDVSGSDISEEEQTEADEKLGSGSGKCSDVRASMAVDWSGERIPVLDPVTGGTGASEDADLIYVSGDASVKEIVYPAPEPEMREETAPYIPEIKDPSANVAAEPEPVEGD